MYTFIIDSDDAIYRSHLSDVPHSHYPPRTQSYRGTIDTYPASYGYPSTSDYQLTQTYPVTEKSPLTSNYQVPPTYSKEKYPKTSDYLLTQSNPVTQSTPLATDYQLTQTAERSPLTPDNHGNPVTEQSPLIPDYQLPQTYPVAERSPLTPDNYRNPVTENSPLTPDYQLTQTYPVTQNSTSSVDYLFRQRNTVTKETSLTPDFQLTPPYPVVDPFQPSQTRQTTYDGTYSRTPSPGDSGIDTATSPTTSPNPGAADVDEILAKLSQKSTSLANPEPVVSDAKPQHSFLALVSMAILSSPDRKLVLSDIYRYIMDNFPYYNNRNKAWRNSVRHNLSLNECFIKNGRSEDGKGNYWSLHPAVADDFANGDFRRRQARRKSRGMAKVICSDNQKPADYVTMTPSSVAYHPYSTTVYYPQHTRAHVTSSQPQTSARTYPVTTSYVPNSDCYQYSYQQYTSRNTLSNVVPSAASYFNQLPTSDYGMMTSHTSANDYNATSGSISSSDSGFVQQLVML